MKGENAKQTPQNKIIPKLFLVLAVEITETVELLRYSPSASDWDTAFAQILKT